MTTNPLDLAWAAGILDGEGSVTLEKKTSEFRQPAVTVSSTDFEIVEELRRVLGGVVVPVPIRAHMKKPAWVWKAQGRGKVVPILQQLVPFMRCPKKKRRAEHIIAHYPLVVTPNGRYTPQQRLERIGFQERFYEIG